MPLGVEIGLGPGDFVLDGEPTPLPKKGAKPPIFGPCLLWPNGWMDQDGTCHGDGPRPRRHWFSMRTQFPPKKGTQPPIFGPCLLWPNGCMYQDTTWYGGRPQPRRHCVRWGPRCACPKGAQPPNFLPMSVVANRLDGQRCHLVRR